LHIGYCVNGKEQREAAKGKDGKNTNDAATAEKYLRKCLNEIAEERTSGRAFETVAMRR
jgi:hypothetical protein